MGVKGPGSTVLSLHTESEIIILYPWGPESGKCLENPIDEVSHRRIEDRRSKREDYSRYTKGDGTVGGRVGCHRVRTDEELTQELPKERWEERVEREKDSGFRVQ